MSLQNICAISWNFVLFDTIFSVVNFPSHFNIDVVSQPGWHGYTGTQDIHCCQVHHWFDLCPKPCTWYKLPWGLRWKEEIFGMLVCMITEQDKKIHVIAYEDSVR